jgi:hypothetical protein
MSGHADTIRLALGTDLLDQDDGGVPAALAALDALVAENQQQTEALHRCRDDYHTKVKALVAENQQQGHKVAAYDAARAKVKIEGNTRAYYVLRAEKAEAEIQQLRDALERMDGVARSAIAFVPTPYKSAELELRRISASALAGTPSEDT